MNDLSEESLYHVLPNCRNNRLVSRSMLRAARCATYILESKKLVTAVFPYRSCILQHLFQRGYFYRRLVLLRFYRRVFCRCRTALISLISGALHNNAIQEPARAGMTSPRCQADMAGVSLCSRLTVLALRSFFMNPDMICSRGQRGYGGWEGRGGRKGMSSRL